MPAPALVRSSYRSRPTPARRAASLALALGLVLLVIAALIGLGVVKPFHRDEQPTLATFNVLPPSLTPSAPSKQIKKPNKAASGAAPATPTPPQPKVAPPPTPPQPKPVFPKMLSMSKDAFASTDIGSLPSHAGEGEGDKGDGKDAAAPYGPGEGPGGAPLYPVRWYKEPTGAEFALYMPKGGIPTGSANIACRMIEHYHVENCRELDETPPGSGLSRMLRQAAWQFLVVPPKRGGKELLGEWVRIHFDWRDRPREAPRSEGIMGGPGHPPPDGE